MVGLGEGAGLCIVGDLVGTGGFAIVGRGVGTRDGMPCPDIDGLGVPGFGCLPFAGIPFGMPMPVAPIVFGRSLVLRSPPLRFSDTEIV